MQNTDSKPKQPTTRRKPFREVSNGVSSSKSVSKIKKLPASQHQSIQKDASLDRLLLVHSDLSSLLRQTDELVVEALKCDLISRDGLNELESFTQVLSSIQTSLKPWVPRIQKALSNCSNQSDIEEEDSIESPEEIKTESGVSPSPLVSWRGDFANEGGTQLFLLTPMPKPKSISSKLCLTRRIPSSIIAISTNTDDDLLKSVGGGGVANPNKASFVVMKTPWVELSPPKSCLVLESPKNNAADRKSTPFPLGVNRSYNEYYESSSSDEDENENAFKNMALKYSELMGGIVHVKSEKVGNGRKNLDSSPFWFLSPPKTCLVMEPQEDGEDSTKPSKSIALDLAAAKSIKNQHPGENTLKKELWSKFETASDQIHSIRYNPPPSITQKDFLDRLEEASSCEYC